jgi:5-methyltetrahydrofolate--homocysteine methyltransferase
MNTRERLNQIAAERILILDGAMGSMIQTYQLTEEDFRCRRFAAHPRNLLGCNDLLCLTMPELIEKIHVAYLEAGADIIETCSFNATAVSLGDYGLEDLAYEISAAAARTARAAADRYSTAEKPRFVAGSMGPTAKSGSISPDMDDPGKRSIGWDELEAAYYENARGLLDGGADILLIETVFDTLNAKAAISAVSRLLRERQGRAPALADFPLMISATIADAAGRLLSGQTVEAFCISVLHADPWALGLNCSFGAEGLRPSLMELAAAAPCLVSAYPNAGLLNQAGEYDETPEAMALQAERSIQQGLVNILGGCCGSTPAHIAAIAGAARGAAPRIPPPRKGAFLAGLEGLELGRDFTLVGERAHAPGSRKFLKMIQEERYRDALAVVRKMIDQGARVINLCMDDAFLDAPRVMKRFLNLALSDPDIARLPFMIDSSRWEALEAGLKCLQGKGLVNSLSLKEGEEEFLRKALLARSYGAAVVVMLFDEEGQAGTYQRRIGIAGRSYALLTGAGFPPEDIVFDPNVFAIATGIPEHDRYALDFIDACRWIRCHCPGAQISAGVSNLSYSFRGNDRVREAMHAVFIKHAHEAGLTMAIVNPAEISYEEVEPSLRRAVEDLILCKSPDPDQAVEQVLALALESKGRAAGSDGGAALAWRTLPVEERIRHAMIKGQDDYIEADIREARGVFARSLDVVEGPLMRGMQEVGDLFSQGEMFLPQVIRSARVMKKAVAALEPFMEEEKASLPAGPQAGGIAPLPSVNGEECESPPSGAGGGGRILLATVKGDVHDIGKNIVGVVLGCNGYEILDLGVMVPPERIIEAAQREKAAVIGLSGLIAPSLDEMVRTAREMERQGLTIPLLIGGAAAGLAYTALRIAPEYSGPVVYVPDASRSAAVVRSLLSETARPRFLEELEGRYREAAAHHQAIQDRRELLPLEEARKNRLPPETGVIPEPRARGIMEFQDYPLERIIPALDWKGFLRAWDMSPWKEGFSGKAPEREQEEARLLEEARAVLEQVRARGLLKLRGALGFFPASSRGDDLILYAPPEGGGPGPERARFSFLRSQEKKRAGGPNPCLADFIPPEPGRGWIGLFALSAGFGLKEAEAEARSRHDDYGALILAALANSLAEAFTEDLHLRVRRELWGYAPEERLSGEEIARGAYQGIRPAFGYPACPDHQDKGIAFDLLGVREKCGMELTPTGMIVPAASVCGMFFSSPRAHYFGLGALGEDQMADWADRKGVSVEEARRRIGR